MDETQRFEISTIFLVLMDMPSR